MQPARPVRILYCIDSLARGGTELQLMELIRRLDRERCEPHLLTLRPYDTQAFAVDCPHLAWQVPRVFSPHGMRSIGRLAGHLRRNRFDTVHTFFQDATLVGALAGRLAGVPQRLAGFRDLGFWRTPAQDRVLRPVYRTLTGFTANSRAVRDCFSREFGLRPERFRVIYNGVDISRYPWVEHPGPATDVGIVGNLNRRVKRTDLFLRAAGLLAPDFPQVRWHILGEGELRAEYEELARSVGLGDRVFFAGSVDNVAGYLERLQIAVLCSDSEGLSNALLEYLFKGCAAVASDVGGNPELIRHGETGLLVPPDDPRALAEALRKLLADPEERRRMARSARETVESTFGWDRCVSEHLRLYCGRD